MGFFIDQSWQKAQGSATKKYLIPGRYHGRGSIGYLKAPGSVDIYQPGVLRNIGKIKNPLDNLNLIRRW
jgi:hypothetical protein